MAALYLHNAIWTPEQPPEIAQTATNNNNNRKKNNHNTESPQRPRRMRSLSAGTLRTASPDYSHPTEPLLRGGAGGTTTAESIAYRDLLARQPTHPDGPQAGWDVGLSLEGDPPSVQERKMFREQSLRRRMRKLRMGKGILEVVFAAWALYNIVRYFLAYNIYAPGPGQTFSLALGTSVTLSLAFLMSAALISLFRQYLLLHHVSIDSILFARTVLQWLLSVFLLTPALASFILVFVWRTSPNPELNLGSRCYLDVDVVWSVSRTLCVGNTSPRWAAWLALSLLRLVFTLADLTLYHILSRAYYNIRRPSWTRKSPRFRRLHLRNIRSAREASSRSSPFQPLVSCQTSAQFTSPLSTLPKYPQTTVSTKHTMADYRSLRSNSIGHSRSGGSRTLTNNSPSFVEKELPPTPEFDLYANFDPSMPLGPDEPLDDFSPSPPSSRDGELTGFVDRFRSIVAQVARDMQEGMNFGPLGSDTGSSSIPSTPTSAVASYSSWTQSNLNSNDTSFNPYAGYAHGPPPPALPPPPLVEERVRMMGAYVRRMPTIESLGSREMGSVAHSSVHHAEGGSVTVETAPSRRSTRMSTYSTMSSSASSRLSAYHTNLGHQMTSVVVGGGGGGRRASLDSERSASFHTAVSGVSGSSSLTSSSPRPPPPPVPPKDPLHIP